MTRPTESPKGRVVGVDLDDRGWPVFRVSELEDARPAGAEVQGIAVAFQVALDELDQVDYGTNLRGARRDALLKQIGIELEELRREDARDVDWRTRAARKLATITANIRAAFGVPREIIEPDPAATSERYCPYCERKTCARRAARLRGHWVCPDCNGCYPESTAALAAPILESHDPETAPKVHRLKSWPRFFSAILEGSKTFDFRPAADRIFEGGDYLQLHEWDPTCDAGEGIGGTLILPGFTGRELLVQVLSVSIVAGHVRFDAVADGGQFLNLAGRLAILSISLIPPSPEEA